MDTDEKEQELLAIKAAAWVERLARADDRDRAEFIEWLRQSPRHVQEFLLAMSWDAMLENVDPDHHIDVDALVERARANVVSLHASEAPTESGPSAAGTRSQRHVRKLASRWTLFFAALPVAVAMAFAVVSLLTIDNRASTGEGEWKSVELADGSLARIAPQSSLKFEFSRNKRVVRLGRGQAMFYVARDAGRPFLVVTDAATALAVGTAFGVTRGDGKVLVTVRDGIVAVSKGENSKLATAQARSKGPNSSDVRLVAGEQAIVDKQSPIQVRGVDLAAELSWAEERLVLKGTVGDAVRQFNLRNHHQIVITDPAIEKAMLRGVMDLWDTDSLIATLEQSMRVEAVRNGDQTLLKLSSTTRGDGNTRSQQEL